jgi:hypothetical protein
MFHAQVVRITATVATTHLERVKALGRGKRVIKGGFFTGNAPIFFLRFTRNNSAQVISTEQGPFGDMESEHKLLLSF